MSIKQKARPAGRSGHAASLPDFRNLGVVLRTVVLVNALGLAAVLVRNGQIEALFGEFLDMAVQVEFPLILCVAALFLLKPLLQRLPYAAGVAAVLGVVVAVALLSGHLLAPVEADEGGRPLVWSLTVAALVLVYFHQRGAALAPVLAEARLLALTARIRPHFLFNSLNAVLGIMREDPRRAERALEELSDLFRVLMRENRDLVTLGDELALCRQYIALETLRLGERLSVRWQTDGCPADARVPPLMLQPLLENAVYHGVEPLAGNGEVRVSVQRAGGDVVVEIDNPAPPRDGATGHSSGNRMALDNIRERLMLFFDLEAQLEAGEQDGLYRVRIRFPYRVGA